MFGCKQTIRFKQSYSLCLEAFVCSVTSLFDAFRLCVFSLLLVCDPINRPFGDHFTSPQSYRYAQLHKPLLGMTYFVILQYLSNIIPLLSYIHPCSHDSLFCFYNIIFINIPFVLALPVKTMFTQAMIPAGHGIFPGIILLHGGGTKEKDFKGLERWEEWLDLRRSADPLKKRGLLSGLQFNRIANWTKSAF